jgi:hypothetical protein
MGSTAHSDEGPDTLGGVLATILGVRVDGDREPRVGVPDLEPGESIVLFIPRRRPKGKRSDSKR